MVQTTAPERASRSSLSTEPARQSDAALRRFRAARRVIIAVLVAFVAVGMTGLLGSRTAGVTATSGGYQLNVIYPRVTRPGLPVRWIYTVRHPGGFSGKIEIATTFGYLNLFDLTGIDPDASSQTATGGQIVWSFDPPPGEVFSVAFDAAAEAGIHEAPPATASVLVHGKPIVHAQFQTVVVP